MFLLLVTPAAAAFAAQPLRMSRLAAANRAGVAVLRADECLFDSEAAIDAVRDEATANMIRGAWAGGSFGSAATHAASKIRKATEAAVGARSAIDPNVLALADCLTSAEDAKGVDECMAQYCDGEAECEVTYADFSCDEEAEEAEVPAQPVERKTGILNRILSRFRR